MNDTKIKKTGSRGRPREFDRSVALDRALEAFWRNGYEATSLADLTAAMEITPPSLYAAFGSKSALFLEAVERYAVTYGAYAERALAEEPTAYGAIRRLLHEASFALAASPLPPGCLMITAATNCSPASADIAEALRQRRIVSEAALRARLERGTVAGEFPEGTDIAALSKFLATVIQGMSIQARDGATQEELAQVASIALEAWPGGGHPPQDIGV